MAEKDYISEERMSEYDALIKQYIEEHGGGAESIAIEDKPSLNKLLVTLNPNDPQTKAQYLVARDPYTAPATPTFSPVSGGSGNGSLAVTISCTSSDVTIKYSTNNGTTWVTGTSVTLQQDANEESKSYTLKAKAVNNTSGLESEIATATYTVKRKVATPTISNPTGNANSASRNVVISGASGSTLYWRITDGTTETTGNVLASAAESARTLTISTQGTWAIYVTAKQSNWVDSSQAEKTGIVVKKIATPTISVDNTNKYAESHVVTLNCDTSGAAIHYTTDGTNPTASSPSVAPGGTITLSNAGTYTVKVMATKTNWTDSDGATKSDIIVGAKKCYIGQAASVSTLSDVESLANAYEQDTLVGSTKDVNVASSSATAQYTWFAIPNTAAKNLVVTVNNDSMPTPVPLQAAGGVLIPSTNSVYRVWRSKDPLFNLTGTYDFKFA